MQPFLNRACKTARGLLFLVSALTLAQFFGASTAEAACPAPPGSNKIVVENCLAGTPESTWNISGSGDSTIQGCANDISYSPSDTVQFKISTNASSYHIDIYRLGWYGGNGARFVTTIPNASITKVNPQPACLTDSSTGIYDCSNWSVNASWTVPAGSVSGI